MGIKLLACGLSAVVFLFVLELVRREKLTFKYAFAWLFFSSLGVFFSVFHGLLFSLSRLFGFELPSNFIFFGLLSIFIVMSLLLTVFLSQQNRRNDRMAQKIGMLELEIQKLKERKN
ncbi:MAG: DUF2304 domain-containing protein [Candidatus Omnitrophica bacterium]|nr:DUF2304 domain-containing protein [Candidatus Omnitrophota bacterium]